MNRLTKAVSALLVGLFLLPWVNVGAAQARSLDEDIWEANEVLKEFLEIPENSIPPSLLRSSEAIAIFPNVAKAGFILAGKFGRGVVIRRNPATGKWSAPAFFKIGGGSVGFQLGGEMSDLILVVTSERGVKALLQNKVTLGLDANVAAGPVGRDTSADTDWKLNATILSYSRARGVFAGVSVKGTVINEDSEANINYYGSEATLETILKENKFAPSDEAKNLIQTVEAHAG